MDSGSVNSQTLIFERLECFILLPTKSDCDSSASRMIFTGWAARATASAGGCCTKEESIKMSSGSLWS